MKSFIIVEVKYNVTTVGVNKDFSSDCHNTYLQHLYLSVLDTQVLQRGSRGKNEGQETLRW